MMGDAGGNEDDGDDEGEGRRQHRQATHRQQAVLARIGDDGGGEADEQEAFLQQAGQHGRAAPG